MLEEDLLKDVMCYDGIDLQQVEKSLRDLLGRQERPAPCHNPEQPELT